MKPRLTETLDLAEKLIRAGRHAVAKKNLKTIPIGEVPRESLSLYAGLLRRTGAVNRALRALNPIVRDQRALAKPTDKELIEYACSLVRVGANDEARAILEGIDSDKESDALLYTTFSLTPDWRYEETIAPLEKYIRLSADRPYQRLIAEVNLLAALVFCERLDEAKKTLSTAKKNAQAQESWFLLGSLYELAAQIAIKEGRFDEAEESLAEGAKLLGSSNTPESFYVVKWQTLLGFSRNPGSFENRSALARLRARAFEVGDWETARDCDYQALKGAASPELFHHLYAGSPNSSYRSWLEQKLPQYSLPTPNYVWRLDGTGTRAIHLVSGCLSMGKRILETGDAPHRLLILLARDFYRPQSVGSLAARVFPGEHYHPIHTPMKMHQILGRLRESLAENAVPLAIEAGRGFLKFDATSKYSVIKDWRLDTQALDATQIRLYPIEKRFGDRSFSAKEAALVLDTSLSTASRLLERACAHGAGVRTGKGRSTRYTLTRNETPSKSALRSAS